MKHTWTATVFLIGFFLIAQFFGLFLISKEASIIKNENGTTVQYENTSIGARPETTGGESLLYVLIGVGIGTILILILVKFQKANIWKAWFFLAVWLAMSVSLGVLIKKSVFNPYDLAIGIALALAIWKLWHPNMLIHNVTEVLVYSGIALILAPLFTLFWAIILLVIISLYDVYAVWHSKHMVKMAQFQTQSSIFAGLMVHYRPDAKKHSLIHSHKHAPKHIPGKTTHAKTAILGGGDVVFPLIFTGVVFQGLLVDGLSKAAAYLQSSIIIFTTTIALTLLFYFSKKGHFYPAMPFVTAGCLVGWVIVWLI